MTVKEFVEDTLVQIVEGIKAGQERIGPSGAFINQKGMSFQIPQLEGRRYNSQTFEVEEHVRFDLAVTIESGTGTKGGVGVFLGGVTLGAQGQSANKDLVVNRVQFNVPIVFPQSSR
jgi:hypothetical protein